ncbi:hypothetical protein F5Y08DRAFT_305228 [Xylaria arbuscula]|nr:hypothetical protein F5Y08DRAFT_305228 [Xylaria arbuscula]
MAAAEAAAEVLSKAFSKTFRTGNKQVFLPAHGITFLHSKHENPNFAKFKVPLRFNKFDLRDYLLHVYNTRVLAVRSQVYNRPWQRERFSTKRPGPIKTMTVQLAQPFVFPSKPADEKPWTNASVDGMKKDQEDNMKHTKTWMLKSLVPLRDEQPAPVERRNMRAEAKRLLREGGWSNKRELDPRWTETKKT